MRRHENFINHPQVFRYLVYSRDISEHTAIIDC